MKLEHKTIREMLRKLTLPAAKEILKTNLPKQEYYSIYYADVEKEDLNFIADTRLFCSEASVKKYRRQGYEKLSSIYFNKK